MKQKEHNFNNKNYAYAYTLYYGSQQAEMLALC